MHTDMRTYMHTDMHTDMCTYMRTDMHTDMPTYMHTDMHTCMRTDMHTDMHTYMRTYMRTDMHTHMRTDMRTDIRGACATNHLKALIATVIVSTWLSVAAHWTCRRRCRCRADIEQTLSTMRKSPATAAASMASMVLSDAFPTSDGASTFRCLTNSHKDWPWAEPQ